MFQTVLQLVLTLGVVSVEIPLGQQTSSTHHQMQNTTSAETSCYQTT